MATDALAVLREVVDLALPAGFEPMPYGDANCSGGLTAVDALIILAAVVGHDVSDYCIGTSVVHRVALEPDSATLGIGDTLRLKATLFDANADSIQGRTLSWLSADTTIASVDANGLVTAVSIDTTWVHAISESVSDSTRVAVGGPTNALKVLPAVDTLRSGADTARFTVIAYDSLGAPISDPEIVWSTTDTLIARHDSAGSFVGTGVGAVGIVASYLGRADTAALVVDVDMSEIFITSDIDINRIVPGSTYQFTLKGRDDFSTFFLFDGIWGSSAPAVATVDSTGLVTAVAEGTASISAVRDGLFAPAWYITVRNPSDVVEAMISNSFATWWSGTHHNYPGPALSVMADDHTSSWGNWGMRDLGSEPRQAFNNDPAYSYAGVNLEPWIKLNTALVDVREGLLALDGGGIEIGEGGVDTPRARAFAKLVQALSLGTLAQLFDQAFIVDENSDLEALELVPYEQVWAAAQTKYAEAISIAQSNTFEIPTGWVGFNGAWTNTDFVAFAKAYRARYSTQVHRTEAGRTGMDWNAVLADLSGGLPFDFATSYDGNNWGWARDKLHTAYQPGWARMDIRTIGPGDTSGKWEEWLAAVPADRLPFNIVTPDSRITAPGDPEEDGKYFEYRGDSPFPASRGTYHYSHYISTHWKHINTAASWVGIYPDFVDLEVDFLLAEAKYRLGDHSVAMEVVNATRANGDLPPFTSDANPDGSASCVPQMPDGSCGDLWEALKYEKRIELFHYGFGTAYFDDRGWGDLVERTPFHLPVPGSELILLGLDIYTFGGDLPPMERAAGRTAVPPEVLRRYWEGFMQRAGPALPDASAARATVPIAH